MLVHAVTGPTAAVVKYYVVKPPVGGQREYLYDIALRTLGNGNRYPEIFGLNAGRVQPDGGRLTDPTQLQAGWVLVLPDDARGPDVRTGVLSSLFHSSGSPSAPTRPAGTRSAGGTTGVAQPPLLRIGALGLMVLFATLAVALLSAGRRSHQPRAAARARRSNRGDMPAVRANVPPARPAAATRELGASSVPPTSPVVDAPQVVRTVADPFAPVQPTSATVAAADDGAARTPPEFAETVGDAAGLIMPECRAEVSGSAGTVRVRLIGVRPGDAAGWGWCEPGLPPQPAVLPVVLGEHAGRRLWVDLARAPDVLSVAGSAEGCRRAARELIGQLLTAGYEVTVVGDALGRPAPAGCRELASLPSTPDPAGDPELPGVVVCAGGDAPAAVRPILARPDRLTVPIVLGEVPAARWSLTVVEPRT